MKLRTFFITFLAPCVIFLLAAQLAFTIWTNNIQMNDDIKSLKMAVILDSQLKEDSVTLLTSQIHRIANSKIEKITPEQELERFKSKSGVDIMSVLSENPFGVTLLFNLSVETEPIVQKTAISKIKGVYSVTYPESKLKDIHRTYEDLQVKYIILAVLLSFSILLIIFMSEKLECTTNQQTIAEKRADRIPLVKIRSIFYSRSFVKGTLIGFVASVLFFSLRFALSMNNQVDIMIDVNRCLIISAVTIISSALLTFIMQAIVFGTETSKK